MDDRFLSEPDPDNPGWTRWTTSNAELFNNVVFGPVLMRAEGPNRARIRVQPRLQHANLFHQLHGGAALAYIDICLFAAARALETGAEGGSTLDVSAQFFAPGRLDAPLDAAVELLRETGRFLFMRGLLEQEGVAIVSFNGTVRKASGRISDRLAQR